MQMQQKYRLETIFRKTKQFPRRRNKENSTRHCGNIYFQIDMRDSRVYQQAHKEGLS